MAWVDEYGGGHGAAVLRAAEKIEKGGRGYLGVWAWDTMNLYITIDIDGHKYDAGSMPLFSSLYRFSMRYLAVHYLISAMQSPFIREIPKRQPSSV